jgi:hypothetical protein
MPNPNTGLNIPEGVAVVRPGGAVWGRVSVVLIVRADEARIQVLAQLRSKEE